MAWEITKPLTGSALILGTAFGIEAAGASWPFIAGGAGVVALCVCFVLTRI